MNHGTAHVISARTHLFVLGHSIRKHCHELDVSEKGNTKIHGRSPDVKVALCDETKRAPAKVQRKAMQNKDAEHIRRLSSKLAWL
jgi:hypothetical protein